MLFKILSLACIFSTCVQKDPKYYTASKDFTFSFNKGVQARHDLRILGWGGVFDNGVKGLYIDYESPCPCNDEKADKILKEIMAELICAMNKDEGLRPYLLQFPITEKNISISIAFTDNFSNMCKPLSQIDFYDQKISYSTFNEETKKYNVYKEKEYHLK